MGAVGRGAGHRRRQRLLRTLAGGVVALALGLAGVRYVRRPATGVGARAAGARVADGDVRAPAGVRVTVEVLNASRTRGLGRRATFYLRDRGFDVVAWGNAPEAHDSTLVIDRSGHTQWARLVAAALGHARVESHPDSSRDVDVSVVVGSSWRPPAQPFYP